MAIPSLSRSSVAQQVSNFPSFIPAGRAPVFLGDSITFGSVSNTGFSFPYMACNKVSSSARIAVPRPPAVPGTLNPPNGSLAYIAGFPGEDSTELLARFDTAVTPNLPGVVVVLAGTNDYSREPIANWQANMRAIFAKVRALGVPMVVCTIPPVGTARSEIVPRTKFIHAQNLWLKQWAPANGVFLADTYKALADPTTGYYQTQYDYDGIHPNTAGHVVMGDAVAVALKAARPAVAPLISAANVGSNPNPLMTTAGGGPTGYTGISGQTMTNPTYSCPAPTTSSKLAAGNWAEMDCNATTGGFTGLRRGITLPSPTGVHALVAQVELEDVTGGAAAFIAGTAGWSISVQNGTGATTFATISSPYKIWDPTPDPHLFLFRITAGDTGGALILRCDLPTGTRVKFRFGCVDLISLTDLGLTTI